MNFNNMKKFYIISSVVLSMAFGLSSCNKTKTCFCKVLGQNHSYSISNENDEKNQAECAAIEVTQKLDDPNASCKVK